VLFDPCAASLPFLSGRVGNAAEIAGWPAGGVLCPAEINQHGCTHVDPVIRIKQIEKLVGDSTRLPEIDRQGREASRRRYTCASMVRKHEEVRVAYCVREEKPTSLLERTP
jgi:hypothetical protein